MTTTTTTTFPYAAILAEVADTGGATYSAYHDTPTTGYMVSIPGHEVTTPISDFTADTIAQYVGNLFDSESNAFMATLYLGIWVDADTVYLDISQHIQDLDEAILVADLHNQLAIYALATQSVITTTRSGS
jgi:hypothetical protein